jgi:hypothetical protein
VAVMTGFFDTSVLLAGLIEFGPMSVEAQRVMAGIAARRARRPHTAWHCCLEFYAVSTRLPEELRLSPSDALRLIEEEILARFRVHQLPERVQPEFLRGVGEVRYGRFPPRRFLACRSRSSPCGWARSSCSNPRCSRMTAAS